MELQLIILFIIKHFIVDFLLQTKYQYSNKGIYLHLGGLIHSFLHLISTVLVLTVYFKFNNILLKHSLLYLGFIDFITHYHIDYFKIKIQEQFNLKPNNSEKYWYLLGLDQTLHLLTYCLIIYLLI